MAQVLAEPVVLAGAVQVDVAVVVLNEPEPMEPVQVACQAYPSTDVVELDAAVTLNDWVPAPATVAVAGVGAEAVIVGAVTVRVAAEVVAVAPPLLNTARY